MGKVRIYKCENCTSVFKSRNGYKSRTPRFCSLKCFGENLVKKRWNGSLPSIAERKKVWRAEYYRRNKEKEAIQAKVWRKNNPENKRAWDKRYYDKRQGNPLERLRRLRANALKWNIPYEKDTVAFTKWLEQEKKCAYCGISAEEGKKMGYKRFLQIDKIIPDLGYVLGNIVLCCWRCNTIKGNWFTFDEMKKIVKDFDLANKVYTKSKNIRY